MRVLKESFNAGEFTPKLYSRYELEKYKNGCKTLTNFVPIAQGPVKRRPGTEYISSVKTAAKYTRLIPFEFSEDDAYVLEFGHQYIRFYRNGGQVRSADSNTKLLLHFDGTNNDTTITDSGNTGHSPAVANDAKLKTDNKKFGTASCYFDGTGDSVTTADHADWNFADGNFAVDMWVRFSAVTGSNMTLFTQEVDATHNIRLTYNGSGGGISFVVINGGSNEVEMTYTWVPTVDTWYHIAVIRGWGGNANDWALCVNGSAEAEQTVTYTMPDLAAAFDLGSGVTGDFHGYIDEFRVSKGAARWTATFDPPSTQYPFGDNTGSAYEVATTYVEADLPTLQYVQSADVMYIVHKDYVVRKLTRSDHDSWAIANVSFTNAPAEWSAADYPRTIEFYEDRLCFGGTPDQPDTIWTSDTADYTNFTSTAVITATTIAFVDGGASADTITDSGNGFVTAGFVANMPITVSGAENTANDGNYTISTVAAGTLTLIKQDALTTESAGERVTIDGGDAADDESIDVTLAARRVNDIAWMSSGRRLIVGTIGEEWWLSGPSDTEPITPSNKVAKRDSAWGSEPIMPVNIGDVIFFIQQNGKILREMVYDFGQDKYISSDITVLAEHLTEDYSITAMAYQQHPYQILWCVRSDGTVLALTYLREHKVFGWSTHSIGSGVVESVTTIPGDPEDEVWFVVRRTIDSSTVRYIERLKSFNWGSSIEDAFFMDCGLSYDGTAATTISGLDHLEGEGVTVLADGAVVTGKTVSSGDITLSTAASKVHVGLANTPVIETLDVVTDDREGTLQSVFKRITNITLRTIDSKGGLFGPSSSVTDAILYSDGTNTYPYTGWTKDLEFDEDYDQSSTIYITCDEPLPFELAAIMIDLED